RVQAVAVHLERRTALVHEVELLVRLLVLLDDPVAGGAARPRAHAEPEDAEVVPHRAPAHRPVGALLDLVQVHDRRRDHGRILRAGPRADSLRHGLSGAYRNLSFGSSRSSPYTLPSPGGGRKGAPP